MTKVLLVGDVYVQLREGEAIVSKDGEVIARVVDGKLVFIEHFGDSDG